MSEFPLGKYATKEDIYYMISYLKWSLGLDSYPLDSKSVAQQFCRDLKFEYLDFDTTEICGILYKGDNSTTIGLNNFRTEDQQNFDCAHELVHYYSHDIPYCKCVCSESNQIRQESTIEYQANEGAAQLLVPYEYFISDVCDVYCEALSSYDIDCIINDLAMRYRVTDAVISVRLQSLKYEIFQYTSGVPIEDIRIISDRRQRQEGIIVESIIDVRNRKRTEEDMERFKLCMREANVYAI